MSKRTRVMIVDDSRFMRNAIARIIDAAPDFEVSATASSGDEALEKLRETEVDVVTLDVVMPGSDGVQTLRRIMAQQPVPVIMLSTVTSDNADVTVECLQAGAFDFIQKPAVYTHMNMPSIAAPLLDRLRAAAGTDSSRLAGAPPAPRVQPANPRSPRVRNAPAAGPSRADMLVIGSSTGGPQALGRLVASLPPDFEVPVLIVQHMPAGFTAALAARLDGTCRIEVKETADGDLLRPGRVLIAKAGSQVTLQRKGDVAAVRLGRSREKTAHAPSVDVTMGSAASVFGHGVVGVLLTGMGSDGASGMAAIRRAGGHTYAEDESTAVIFGMPKAAADAGAVSEMLPLGEIIERVSRLGGVGASSD